MISVRQLLDTDIQITDEFLEKHSESCLFMRSNIADAGLVYRGLRHQGDHYGAFMGEELIGVMGHYWNGNLMLQMDNDDSTAIKALAKESLNNALFSNRSVRGIFGPDEQVQVLLKNTDLKKFAKKNQRKEHLLGMNLDELIMPEICFDPDYSIRLPVEADRELMNYWRYEFEIETGLSKNSPETKERVSDDVQHFMTNGRYWLFEYQKNPVSFVGFNAIITDTVQPGGVWTPPQQRNKGYARAATAMILQLAREEWGKTKSVLFTNNPAAEKAYISLGYRFFGHYALIMLDKPYLPKKEL